MQPDRTIAEIVSAGIHVVRCVIRQILQDAEDDPDNAFGRVTLEHGKGALRLDVNAEDGFNRELHKYQTQRFKRIKVYGEERLRDKKLDLSSHKGIVVLVDAVDGTDLVERGLCNWCTAAVFYKPSNKRGKRLLAAIVGVPSGDIYFATAETDGAMVRRASRNDDEVSIKDSPVGGMSNVACVADASICFYGQKTANFLSVVNGRFARNLNRLRRERKRASKNCELRIYNLAGIPMMMKLIDRRVQVGHTIDAVFELKGQQPHDFVPGAFIAKKAGAVIKDLDGQPITVEKMERLLLKPASTDVKYIIASTEPLCDELLALANRV